MPAPRLWPSRLYELALDAVFPPRCTLCRRFGARLWCDACAQTFSPITSPMCLCCGTPFDSNTRSANLCADCRSNRYHGAPPFDALRSCARFEGALREAIHRFKYQGQSGRAAPLAELLFDYWQADDKLAAHEFALLCPVPLHPLRQWRRGYNQSALLAAKLSAQSGVPHAALLRRVRSTPPQIGLKEKERLANVKGAFAVDIKTLEKLNPSRGPVLLIDDVCTTGATLAECARVLKKAGVKEVCALTLGRQV